MDKRVKNLECHASRWAVCSLCAWDHRHTYLGEWHSRFALLDHYFHTGHNAKDKLRRSVSRGRDQVKPCQSASLSRSPNFQSNDWDQTAQQKLYMGVVKKWSLIVIAKDRKIKDKRLYFFKPDV